MPDNRRTGIKTEVSLQLGNGPYVSHDALAGRAQLETAFEQSTVSRTLPGGYDVDLPLDIRTGRVSYVVLRTSDIDRQLVFAHQKLCNLRIRRRGTGAGLPQRVVPVICMASLTIVNNALAVWRVTLEQTGAVDDTAQA